MENQLFCLTQRTTLTMGAGTGSCPHHQMAQQPFAQSIFISCSFLRLYFALIIKKVLNRSTPVKWRCMGTQFCAPSLETECCALLMLLSFGPWALCSWIASFSRWFWIFLLGFSWRLSWTLNASLTRRKSCFWARGFYARLFSVFPMQSERLRHRKLAVLCFANLCPWIKNKRYVNLDGIFNCQFINKLVSNFLVGSAVHFGDNFVGLLR